MWNGAGYMLEEHLAWFESCAPVSVVGKEQMRLFARYTTADLCMRLEDVPNVFGISLWSEFVSYLLDNYVDRAAKAMLLAREFEDGVRVLSPESVVSLKTAVAFFEGFGQLAMRHRRGGGSEKLVDELLHRHLPCSYWKAVWQESAMAWVYEHHPWTRKTLPKWTWVMSMLKDMLNPDNEMGTLELQQERPEVVTHSKAAEAVLKDMAEQQRKVQDCCMGNRGLWCDHQERATGAQALAEDLSIEDLTTRRKGLVMAVCGGAAEDHRKAAATYLQYRARLVSVCPREAPYWPIAVGDHLGEGEALTRDAAQVYAVAKSKSSRESSL
jgi:hypothetical protein